jgi:eukaryotic-like serine/threonine-protein kinase
VASRRTDGDSGTGPHGTSRFLDAAPTLPGFVVLDRVGSGTFADVYKVRPDGSGPFQALKVLQNKWIGHDDVVACFAKEAELLSAARHPNIVRAMGMRELGDGRRALLMEFIPGRSLAEYLNNRATIGAFVTQRLQLTTLREIAAAVDHLASHGVAHLDIQPANIMVKRDRFGSRVKVIDLGIAQRVRTMHSPVGGNAYSAPEMLGHADFEPARAGKHRYERADVYSFAVLAVEILARFPPPEERLTRAAWATSLPSSVVHLLQTAMSVEPLERPQHALDLVDGLESAFAHEHRVDPMYPVAIAVTASAIFSAAVAIRWAGRPTNKTNSAGGWRGKYRTI